MLVLFLNDCNGHEYYNPLAALVELSEEVDKKLLDKCSFTQLGATRSGGHLSHVLSELKQLGIDSTEIRQGRQSDFKEPYFTYKLISGNY